MRDFDVIVIGGGHAGCEAAHAAARMGCKTLLATLDPSRIGVMSCNPAMGGIAKGQLIREIDALGGIMGVQTDQSGIQFRVLNQSKGPAVRSPRAQCDKILYAKNMQERLSETPNLTTLRAEIVNILVKDLTISGVSLRDGSVISSHTVVITSGTFMQSVMHTGEQKEIGGRLGDGASFGLSSSLSDLGFRLRRLKTGTPPRLTSESIDWQALEEQKGDENPKPFSFYGERLAFPVLPQISCHITYTNEKTHELILKNLNRSPMVTGAITGTGPRYCPSIEDKVRRFSDKPRHQIFLEPESLSTNSIYVNGVSTSLPRDVQEEFIHSVRGLENAKFIHYGYAVEYDAIDARQLKSTLESKDLRGLFLAGQVNGTSGYEEAGGQGLIAGINAAQKVLGKEELSLRRDQAYLGVMVDDLILKGSDEPYRMFTSRAEFRLLLREDNADDRLSEIGYQVGLLSGEAHQIFRKKSELKSRLRGQLNQSFVYPTQETNEWLENLGTSAIKDRTSHWTLLKRPEIGIKQLSLDADYSDIAESIETEIKYEGYIKREGELVEEVLRSEALSIPSKFEYKSVQGLSNEAVSKLNDTRPETIGQAARIQGITPTAVASLMIHILSKRNAKHGSRISP